MAKTRTVINKNHPHNILKNYLAKQKKVYTQLSKLKLRQVANHRGIDSSITGRSRTIAAILDLDKIKFKEDWHKQFHWPFEDCYDKEKLLNHIKNHKIDGS